MQIRRTYSKNSVDLESDLNPNRRRLSTDKFLLQNTSPQKPNQQTIKKKRIRRPKDVRVPRNYMCGCSKTYLSYAALYTHTKTKHNGVFPEGTTTLSRRKQMQSQNDDWKRVRVNSEYQRTYDLNKEFQMFMNKIPGALDEKDKRNKNLIEFFPCEAFKNVYLSRKLLLTLEQIRKELVESYGPNFIQQIDIIIFEINNSRKLNCYQAIALFLIYMFRFCSRRFYRELVFIMVGYIVAMNEKGWSKILENTHEGINQISTKSVGNEKLNVEKDKKQVVVLQDSKINALGNKNEDFCESQLAEVIPLFANFFIVEFFQDYLTTDSVLLSPKSLNFFKMEPINLLWVIILIKFFCQWMFIHRFTKSRVDVHKD